MTKSVAVVTRDHRLVSLLRCYLPCDEKLEVFSRIENLWKAVTVSPPRFLLVDYHYPCISLSEFAVFSVPAYFITVYSKDRRFSTPSTVLYCIPEDIPYLCRTIVENQRLEMVTEIFAGSSNAIRRVRRALVDAMGSNLPVLLTGPSGTGKSLAARLIHDGSERKDEPFFPVNMLSISDALVESELFGVSDGAYTDAKSRPGYFSSAGEGSVFLDEIGDISKLVQGKLLYVVENGTFRAVGSDREKTLSARLIFATNANLLLRVKRGLFREDLFYRLLPQCIHLPALSERKQDIAELAALFLKDSGKYLSPSARSLVETLEWRGNVRQLKNCLLSAADSSHSSVIDARDIHQY